MAGQHDPVLHDLVCRRETRRCDPELLVLQHRLTRDVAREDDAARDAGVLELDLELRPAEARLGPQLDRVAEPGRLGLGDDGRQDELVFVLLQATSWMSFTHVRYTHLENPQSRQV